MATQQTLFSFDVDTATTGGSPSAGLIADAQGNLYGTAQNGGANNTGVVYELVKGTDGYTQQVLFSFDDDSNNSNATGAFPYAGLIADAQGNLYGTTQSGGINNAGAVYELVKGSDGYTQQTLYSFDGATGSGPQSGLIADAQGNLYGTTQNGGVSDGGVVYELVKGTDGYTQRTLFSFDANGSNATGANPLSGLIADAQGNLYGTTTAGGANNTGAVYELVKGGDGYTQRVLFSFAGYSGGRNATGVNPQSGLIADAQGNLYGTTQLGGASNNGTVYELVKGGDGYTQQVLFSFAGIRSGRNATGAQPYAGLIADAQGNLYGTTEFGGTNNDGVVYELVKGANGYTQRTLFSFDGGRTATGADPRSDLIADAQGNLYGTTYRGGTNGNGEVYQLSDTGFAPTCYVTGTGIRVLREGIAVDVAVEDLAIGDVAITASGQHRPIRWIGRRLTRCDRHPEPRKVWPVRIAADTFGSGLPYADLWLSPGHALCLDDTLVPVRGLIDGKLVAQIERASVTYWHVELDAHDVILANGLPAESYLDTGNRRAFDNAEATALHFDEAPAPGYDGSGYCLPMVESGPLLSDLRARYGIGRVGGRSARPIRSQAQSRGRMPPRVQPRVNDRDVRALLAGYATRC